MGITSLLQTLQPCTRKINVSEYAGQRVAVDAYCWLHKAAYSCSSDLCQGIPTNAYISYCVTFLRMMQYNKIIPVVVFDGGRLPSKAATEDDRRQKRVLNKTKGMEYLREGNVTAATSCFQKGVDITPQMAYNLIKVLREMQIEYIVAPFEADAQLAFLAVNHFVHAVVTEDSDLVAYGCPRVLFKMDKMGNGQEVKINDVFLCKNPSFINWNQRMFLHMCILCGCDFLDSLPGVGPKKAHTLIKKYRDIDKVLVVLRSELAMKMPPEFENNFRRAELTFLHQRVWDPAKQAVVHLSELAEEVAQLDLSFLGQEIDDETGYLIANGDIDPHSRRRFENEVVPVHLKAKSFSFQSMSYSAKLKAANLPTQKSKIPNYFLKGSSASNKQFVPPARISEDKSYPQNSSSGEDKTLLPPASPPRSSSNQDDDILAPETPPTQKKRIVVSRFFGGAPGSPKASNSQSSNNHNDPQELHEIDNIPCSLNDSVDTTPTKNNGINTSKLGDSPYAPITCDDDDVGPPISGNKWSSFDNDASDTSGNANIRVENDVLVYASSSKRTGANQTRTTMPFAPLPPINNARISNSRLSLPPTPANELKRNEIHNRFGGFLQQFAFGSSSPSSTSPILDHINDNNESNTDPPPSYTPPFNSHESHASDDAPSHRASPYPTFATSSAHSCPSPYHNSTSSHSHSSESYSSEPHSSEPNYTNPDDLNDNNYVADSQENMQRQNKQISISTKPKKIICKIEDDDDLLSFPQYNNHNINLHYFQQRNSISSPLSPTSSKETPTSNLTNSATSSSIPSPLLAIFPKENPNSAAYRTFTPPNYHRKTTPNPSSPILDTKLASMDKNLASVDKNLASMDKKLMSLDKLVGVDGLGNVDALADLDIVGDSPIPLAPTKRPLFGDLCIGDSDGSGDERKHPVGTKRKIKASSLLAGSPPSPDHPSISRKLTPQNLFGRDDVDEMTGSTKEIKKMRLEPYSLLRQNSDEDASDPPSGKKDHRLPPHDKPLNDTDLSAPPSSKHTPASPSPLPSLSRRDSNLPATSPFPSLSRRDSSPTPTSPPLSLLSSDVGNDLLASSHDFFDQFRFSGSSGATYIPTTTRRFLTSSGSPTGSPHKPRLNRSSSSSSSSKPSFSTPNSSSKSPLLSFSSSPSATILID